MKTKPRIATNNTTDRTEIYNANFAPSGLRIGNFDNPWTVIGPDVFRMCGTHQEAIEYAAGIEAADPTPQERESVTTGWNVTQDRLDAWKEKWELTR